MLRSSTLPLLLSASAQRLACTVGFWPLHGSRRRRADESPRLVGPVKPSCNGVAEVAPAPGGGRVYRALHSPCGGL